ncbi:MAG: hypothetical protein JWR15_36 [Prosthecobacter sp.]|nr:hypothetical protein [Prosthecobacter sp.]
MNRIIVTKEVLELCDQMLLFSEYVDKLHLTKCEAYSDGYSDQMQERTSRRIAELDNVIDPEVVAILKKRILKT